MPDLLRFASCGETWIWLMRHVRNNGGPAEDDRGPIIEASAVLFEITGLTWDDPVLKSYGDAGKIPLYASKFSERTVPRRRPAQLDHRCTSRQAVHQEWLDLAHRPR